MTQQPNHDALTRPFAPDEVLHFQGRGGFTMSYVEDESVMDRLDEAFGIGNWSIKVEPIPVYEGVVKVRIEAGGAIYEDFGYPNREGGDVLKEAVTDGIRRCGRYLGIARDLYRKSPTTQGATSSPRPVAPAPSPAAGRGTSLPRPAVIPAEPEGWMNEPSAVEQARTNGFPATAALPENAYMQEYGSCPDHQVEWRFVPAGISKRTNKPYDAFYSCPEMGCKEKPTQKWVEGMRVTA